MGTERIPYDQTDPMQQVAAPQGAPSPVQPGAPDAGQLGQVGQGAPGGVGLGDVLGQGGGGLGGGAPDLGGMGGGLQGDPGQLGADPSGMGSTDNLTGNDLAALSQPLGDLQSPEDQQMQQMEAVLNDPNADPAEKTQVQQLMDLAARRRLAGIAGGGQGGGIMGA